MYLFPNILLISRFVLLKSAFQMHSALIYLSSQNLYAYNTLLKIFKMINSSRLLVYSAL